MSVKLLPVNKTESAVNAGEDDVLRRMLSTPPQPHAQPKPKPKKTAKKPPK